MTDWDDNDAADEVIYSNTRNTHSVILSHLSNDDFDDDADDVDDDADDVDDDDDNVDFDDDDDGDDDDDDDDDDGNDDDSDDDDDGDDDADDGDGDDDNGDDDYEDDDNVDDDDGITLFYIILFTSRLLASGGCPGTAGGRFTRLNCLSKTGSPNMYT